MYPWYPGVPGSRDAICAVMELRKFTQSDLALLLGSRSRASEILNRKRGLTMEQARLLHQRSPCAAGCSEYEEVHP